VEEKEMNPGSASALACSVRRLAERNLIKKDNISGGGAGNDTQGGCAPQK